MSCQRSLARHVGPGFGDLWGRHGTPAGPFLILAGSAARVRPADLPSTLCFPPSALICHLDGVGRDRPGGAGLGHTRHVDTRCVAGGLLSVCPHPPEPCPSANHVFDETGRDLSRRPCFHSAFSFYPAPSHQVPSHVVAIQRVVPLVACFRGGKGGDFAATSDDAGSRLSVSECHCGSTGPSC